MVDTFRETVGAVLVDLRPHMFDLSILLALSSLLLAADVSGQNAVKWGNQFNVPIISANVRKDCILPDGRPVCCAAVLSNSTYAEDVSKPSRGVGYSFQQTFAVSSTASVSAVTACEITRTYFSSPQEERDLHKSLQLELIADETERLDLLLKYVTSDEMMKNSTMWLDRVRAHMQSEITLTVNPVDREFLSRFHVVRKCTGISGFDSGLKLFEWDEWIEPVNIAARHPFAFSRCRHTRQYFRKKQGADRSDVDYILLQSGKALADSRFGLGNSKDGDNKHYFLDAGTSTFDSSLSWFTCAYSQRGISFNQIYGWEMTLLNPRNYWEKVPAKWKPYWHFFNTPISADPSHPDSPIRLIKTIATQNDFVSFKLDIDHPDTEIPIALSLLQDPNLAAMVDEFFFELHFRCGVMTSCGWGKRIPEQSHGMKLDRPTVLKYFVDLRKKGIRAHIWP